MDDARATGASDAQLFEQPRAIFVAHRPADVARVLAEADAARAESGGTLAGYLAYEAGLALEPRLAPLANGRSGASGPLVWFGLFDSVTTIPSADVPAWLEARGGIGRASIGPMVPQVSTGAYLAGFEHLQEAIRAGDIYQANFTMMLEGAASGEPLAIYRAIRPTAMAGYGGVIFDGSHWLLSFSPELFFTLKGREAKVKPMKGTRPRGATEAEDAAFAEELAHSVKDKAENLMLVDLVELHRILAEEINGRAKIPVINRFLRIQFNRFRVIFERLFYRAAVTVIIGEVVPRGWIFRIEFPRLLHRARIGGRHVQNRTARTDTPIPRRGAHSSEPRPLWGRD
jgi:hypothetical protein